MMNSYRLQSSAGHVERDQSSYYLRMHKLGCGKSAERVG